MKNFKLNIYFLALLGLFFTACSEEIKPSTDGKETAIVYAVLNSSDSIHFVKINKAISASGDLTQSALIPDSSYFDQVDATVTETVNGSVTRTWTLKDTMIANKEEGAFYYPMQKVYYFSTVGQSPLQVGTNVIYKFEANINNGAFVVKSQTTLVGGMSITTPSDISPFSFATNNVSQYGYATSNIVFNPGTSKKVEVFLDVAFEEYENATLVNTKEFRWQVDDIGQEDIKTSLTTSVNGQSFYELVAQNVTKDNPAITKRKLKGITIVIDGASNDLQNYMLVTKPSSSLAQNKPTYTNLTASEGMRVIGIFTSRCNVERYKAAWKYAGGSSYYLCINSNSMKELCQGSITGSYLFCSDSPTDVNDSYFCN